MNQVRSVNWLFRCEVTTINCVECCRDAQVTKLLLVVSVVFLLSNTPSHAVRVYLFAMSLLHTNYKPGYPILMTQNILHYLFYANFAANFLLYNASGRTFRRAMMHCGRRCCGVLRCRRSSADPAGGPAGGPADGPADRPPDGVLRAMLTALLAAADGPGGSPADGPVTPCWRPWRQPC